MDTGPSTVYKVTWLKACKKYGMLNLSHLEQCVQTQFLRYSRTQIDSHWNEVNMFFLFKEIYY